MACKNLIKKERVLVFSKGLLPAQGGVERYGVSLAIALVSLGLRPVVVTQQNGLPGFSRYKGVLVYNVGRGGQILVCIKMLIAARKLINSRKFAFGFATTWRVALPALVLRAPFPIGITIHGREVFAPRGVLAALMRFVLRQADSVFAVSSYTLAECHRRKILAPSRGIRNWNGCEFPDLSIQDRPITDFEERRALRLFTICRLVERKNVQGTICALAYLQRINQLPSGIQYAIAGSGTMLDSLKEMVHRENLENTIQFLGIIDESTKDYYYRHADIFLHPQIALDGGSDVEGFGLVVAEAMSYGIPVIVGKDGGTADFVVNEETGLVVDGNSSEQIARSILRLADSPALRKSLAINGQDWVIRNLSWKSHAKTILNECAGNRI